MIDPKEKPVCPFCKGTGIARSVCLLDPNIPYGEHDLGELVIEYGEDGPCPEGCIIMNEPQSD